MSIAVTFGGGIGKIVVKVNFNVYRKDKISIRLKSLAHAPPDIHF